jgi:hypothetical protein
MRVKWEITKVEILINSLKYKMQVNVLDIKRDNNITSSTVTIKKKKIF